VSEEFTIRIQRCRRCGELPERIVFYTSVDGKKQIFNMCCKNDCFIREHRLDGDNIPGAIYAWNQYMEDV
jgi:hypothetical protein